MREGNDSDFILMKLLPGADVVAPSDRSSLKMQNDRIPEQLCSLRRYQVFPTIAKTFILLLFPFVCVSGSWCLKNCGGDQMKKRII